MQIDGESLGPRRGAHDTAPGPVTVRSLKRVNVRTVPDVRDWAAFVIADLNCAEFRPAIFAEWPCAPGAIRKV